jgi:hypothetical protein
MPKAHRNLKAKVISPDTKKHKYRVIITENREVLFDSAEGDTSAGESFFADSLEEAERILDEHTAVPGKGGVVIAPGGDDEPSLITFPLRTRDDVEMAAEEIDFRIRNFYNRYADFDLGMLAGKRFALNWALGSEWDSEILPPPDLPMRTRDDLAVAEGEFYEKVWYDRHQVHQENGSLKNAPEDIVLGAEAAAQRVEAVYGEDNLGPYTDYEWGVLNGKLSAVRWVLGEEWDELDT